ncbi:MAG: PIN domain-containing protein [Actinomycetota bacterium]
MVCFIDTSMIVRYLTGDPPQLAEQAAEIIDSEKSLEISGVVLAETAYVLISVYEVPREQVVDNLVTLIQKKNISVFCLKKALVLQALLFCRPSGRVSFADAILWAAARSAGSSIIYSLDERFPSDGIEIRHRY